MSEITSADLINACLREIDSWDELPKENHINESGMIDLDYAHILLVYTLKNIHYIGADKDDLVTAIIAQLDYWTSGTPYKDWSDFEGVTDWYELKRWHKNAYIADSNYRNNPEGWAQLGHDVLDGKVGSNRCRTFCIWNDQNGVWGDLDERGFFVVGRQFCKLQVLQWAAGLDR